MPLACPRHGLPMRLSGTMEGPCVRPRSLRRGLEVALTAGDIQPNDPTTSRCHAGRGDGELVELFPHPPVCCTDRHPRDLAPSRTSTRKPTGTAELSPGPRVPRPAASTPSTRVSQQGQMVMSRGEHDVTVAAPPRRRRSSRCACGRGGFRAMRIVSKVAQVAETDRFTCVHRREHRGHIDDRTSLGASPGWCAQYGSSSLRHAETFDDEGRRCSRCPSRFCPSSPCMCGSDQRYVRLWGQFRLGDGTGVTAPFVVQLLRGCPTCPEQSPRSGSVQPRCL